MRFLFFLASLLPAVATFSQITLNAQIRDSLLWRIPAQPLLDGFMPGDHAWVFGGKVDVRATPAAAAASIAQLVGGEEVTIQDTAKFWAENGLNQRWLKVNFTRNGASVQGYVWGGQLAWGHVKLGNMDIVWGGVSMKMAERSGVFPEYQVEIRGYAGGGLRGTAIYQLELPGEYTTVGIALDNLGLKIGSGGGIELLFNGEAAGYPNYYLYVLWDGKRFSPLPMIQNTLTSKTSYHKEQYIFPNDMPEDLRQPERIYLKESYKEELSEDLNETYRRTRTERLLWDGKRYVRQKHDDR